MEENYGQSMLDVNLDDVYEFETIPAGQQVNLRISRAEMMETKEKKEPMLHVTIEDATNPKVDDIHVYMVLPTSALRAEDEKKWNKRALRLKSFYACFDVNTNGPIDVERDLPGLTGDCIVGEEEDENGIMRNTIKKFIAA